MSGKESKKTSVADGKSSLNKKNSMSTSGLTKKPVTEPPKRPLVADNDKLSKIQSFNEQALSKISNTLKSHVKMMKHVVSSSAHSKQNEMELRSVSTRLPKKKISETFTTTSTKFSQPSGSQDPFR